MCAAPQNHIANNCPSRPRLVHQPVIVRKIVIERSSSSSTELPVSKPVNILKETQVLIPNPVIACQTDSSYVLECKITPILKSKEYLFVVKIKDLLDYIMVRLLGARFNEMRPLMKASMFAVLSQIVNGTTIVDPGEEESVGVEESDLRDLSDELVKWCKLMLDQNKPPCRAKLKCTVCAKEIVPHYLETHMKTHSSIHRNYRPYACPICKKQFKTLPIFERHKLIHDTERTRDYKCKHCDYAAFTKTNLVAHMTTHDKDQKLLCKTCGKRFRSKLTLSEHLKRHTDDKTSVCDICGKTYRNVAYLNTHKREIHEGVRKNYTCEVCGEVFTNRGSFKTHKWRHEDYRPYKCDLCDKAFFHSKVLKSHRLIHTGEKPYTCDVCGRSFRQKAALTTHSYTHGAIRPHQCEKCSRQFIHKIDLKRHVCPFADEPNKDDESIDDDLNVTEKLS